MGLRGRLGVAFVVAAIGFTVAAPVSAAVPKYETQTSASFTNRECGIALCEDENDYFSGRVRSSKAACAGDRVVRVYRSDGTFHGFDKSNSSGKWMVSSEDPTELLPTFQYYAVVLARSSRTFVCLRYRTGTFTGDDRPLP